MLQDPNTPTEWITLSGCACTQHHLSLPAHLLHGRARVPPQQRGGGRLPLHHQRQVEGEGGELRHRLAQPHGGLQKAVPEGTVNSQFGKRRLRCARKRRAWNIGSAQSRCARVPPGCRRPPALRPLADARAPAAAGAPARRTRTAPAAARLQWSRATAGAGGCFIRAELSQHSLALAALHGCNTARRTCTNRGSTE